MNVKVYESNYKDQKAVTVESEDLKVQFLPLLGGKMASLIHKKLQKEFLAQGENKEYRILKYDGDYVKAECSGFDDMFPTIDACHYEKYPWQGVRLPDHGEVCGIPWEYKIENSSLTMTTYGVRFPYKLEKHVGFSTGTQLNIDYTATNLSNFDMDYLWAAHPMINAQEGAEIILPFKEGQEMTCVFATDKNLGVYGDTMRWPVITCRDTKKMNMNITVPRNQMGNNYKYYFNEKIPEGWCAYKYNRDNIVLKLTFPEEKVPYFGIWVNEGSFKGLYNFAPEPCTGAFDRIDIAKAHEKNSILKAKHEYSWFLNFEVKKL